ncbi:hypothetical protein LJB90_02765 [Eubacteriales bacterium OttesenSCG-928-G02]|nr:hypothetical protein [Eubacteriales bacterium OttesenSCG-928-G02]
MPVIPDPLPEAEAELTYTAQHKTLEDEAVSMLARKERLISWQEPETQTKTTNNKKGVA